MFIKIHGTRINTDKIVYYYAKPKTEYTCFTIFISFSSNWQEECPYGFDDENEGLHMLTTLDMICAVKGENNVRAKNTL